MTLKGGDMIYDIFHTGGRRWVLEAVTLSAYTDESFDAVAIPTYGADINGDAPSYYRAGVAWKEWEALTEGQRMRLRMEFPNLTPKEVK
jgi:hypothetical protein